MFANQSVLSPAASARRQWSGSSTGSKVNFQDLLHGRIRKSVHDTEQIIGFLKLWGQLLLTEDFSL